MIRRRGFTAILVAAGFLVACGASTTASDPTAVTTRDLPPIDTSIEAVSASKPDAESSAALDACSLTDTTGRFGSNGPLGLDRVSGMGKVTPASAAVKYVALEGAPEIATAAPAWVITTSGWITLPLGRPMKDPTCVYVNGEAYWYVTGDSIAIDGAVVTPMPVQTPELRLPPLRQ